MTHFKKINTVKLVGMNRQQANRMLKESILKSLNYSLTPSISNVHPVQIAFLVNEAKKQAVTCTVNVMNPSDKSQITKVNIDPSLTAIFAAADLSKRYGAPNSNRLALEELVAANPIANAFHQLWKAEEEVAKAQKVHKQHQDELLRDLWWENNNSFSLKEAPLFVKTCSREKLLQIIALNLISYDEDGILSEVSQQFFKNEEVQEIIAKEFPKAPLKKITSGYRSLSKAMLMPCSFTNLQAMECFFTDIELLLEDFDAWCTSRLPNREARRKRIFIADASALDGDFGKAPDTLLLISSSLEAAAWVKENCEKSTIEEIAKAILLMDSAEILHLLAHQASSRDKILAALELAKS